MELNGIFLYFLTCQLTLNKMEFWEHYPVVYLTPDSDWRVPNSLDFSEQETVMLDADGCIIDRSPNEQLVIMDNVNVNLSALYVEPPTWDQIKLVIGAVIADNQLQGSCTSGEPAPSYDIDNVSFNPTLFSCRILERAEQSKAFCAIGACTVNTDGYEIFGEKIFPDGDPYVIIGAATSG